MKLVRFLLLSIVFCLLLNYPASLANESSVLLVNIDNPLPKD